MFFAIIVNEMRLEDLYLSIILLDLCKKFKNSIRKYEKN